ncbi:hypothetical protein AAG570_001486 [Ranatra chinensis]|uniref:Uncharacterized protein n=1 Tax=Ranatra chinensis TaxID=642074 RepID=A0ABD0YV86_9HEMI
MDAFLESIVTGGDSLSVCHAIPQSTKATRKITLPGVCGQRQCPQDPSGMSTVMPNSALRWRSRGFETVFVFTFTELKMGPALDPKRPYRPHLRPESGMSMFIPLRSCGALALPPTAHTLKIYAKYKEGRESLQLTAVMLY